VVWAGMKGRTADHRKTVNLLDRPDVCGADCVKGCDLLDSLTFIPDHELQDFLKM